MSVRARSVLLVVVIAVVVAEGAAADPRLAIHASAIMNTRTFDGLGGDVSERSNRERSRWSLVSQRFDARRVGRRESRILAPAVRAVTQDRAAPDKEGSSSCVAMRDRPLRHHRPG